MDQKLCPSAGSCNLHGSGLFCRLKSTPVEGGKNTVLPDRLQEIKGRVHIVALHGKLRRDGDKDDPAVMVRLPNPFCSLHSGDPVHVDVEKNKVIFPGCKGV